jgi:hypothetical protein
MLRQSCGRAQYSPDSQPSSTREQGSATETFRRADGRLHLIGAFNVDFVWHIDLLKGSTHQMFL